MTTTIISAMVIPVPALARMTTDYGLGILIRRNSGRGKINLENQDDFPLSWAIQFLQTDIAMRNPLKITDLPPHGTEIVGDVLRAEFNQLKNVTLAALAREGMEPLPIIASGRLTVGEHIAGKAGSSREHGYVTFIDIRQIRPETP